MTHGKLGCNALCMSVAAALLAACGGSQPPIGAQGAMPQTRMIAPAHISEWMPGRSSYEVLHRFDGGAQHAGHPHSGLIDVDGVFYGTTAGGGTSGNGTVYTISSNGRTKILYNFQGGADGATPQAGLVNVDHTLYGTTSVGGGEGCYQHRGCGTIYSISISGAEKVLYRFAGGSDGEAPIAGLLAVNGTLYGTTRYGGSGCGSHPEGCGTIYRTSTTGSEKVLYRFGTRHRDDGAYPVAELIDVNGVLYGTTLEGGVGCRFISIGGCGIIYRVTTAGSEKVLYRFRGYPDGYNPAAPLIDVDGTLYGTTSSGGGMFAYGTVFTVTTSGREHVVFSFAGQEGEVPTGGLINVHGDLYGTTVHGGSGCPAGNAICGSGTVYRLTPGASSDVVLHDFAGGSDGRRPRGGLTEANGTLYGTTNRGGRGCGLIGCGTVFALTP